MLGLCCLQTRRLVVQSLVPPDQVSRCPWSRHQNPAAPDKLDGALHGWHGRRCMNETVNGWMWGKSKAPWWTLGLRKCYINVVHLPFIKLPQVHYFFYLNQLQIGDSHEYVGSNVNAKITQGKNLQNQWTVSWTISWSKCEHTQTQMKWSLMKLLNLMMNIWDQMWMQQCKDWKKKIPEPKECTAPDLFQRALMSCSVGVLLTAEIHSSSLTGIGLCRFWSWNSK